MKNSKRVGELFTPEFEKMDLNEVQQNLDGIAYDIKEGKYTKRLTPEEVAQCESQYAYLNIEKGSVKAELDQITKTSRQERRLSGQNGIT